MCLLSSLRQIRSWVGGKLLGTSRLQVRTYALHFGTSIEIGTGTSKDSASGDTLDAVFAMSMKQTRRRT